MRWDPLVMLPMMCFKAMTVCTVSSTSTYNINGKVAVPYCSILIFREFFFKSFFFFVHDEKGVTTWIHVDFQEEHMHQQVKASPMLLSKWSWGRAGHLCLSLICRPKGRTARTACACFVLIVLLRISKPVFPEWHSAPFCLCFHEDSSSCANIFGAVSRSGGCNFEVEQSLNMYWKYTM